MIGIHILKDLGLVELVPKIGSIRSSIIGGVIFGIGFAILGYCPGTVLGAVGQGSLDALIPAFLGLILGSAIFASFYPRILPIIKKGEFKKLTLGELFNLNHWFLIIPISIFLIIILYFIEKSF